MRLRLALFVAVLLVLGAAAPVQLAVASPAQPFAFNGCRDLGAGFTSCFAVSVVAQGNYARAGQLKVSVNAKVDYTFTYQGQPVITQQVNFHLNAHFKDGERQVMQQTQRNRFTFTDNITGSGITRTCSYSSSLMYANGAVRHDLSNGGCA